MSPLATEAYYLKKIERLESDNAELMKLLEITLKLQMNL